MTERGHETVEEDSVSGAHLDAPRHLSRSHGSGREPAAAERSAVALLRDLAARCNEVDLGTRHVLDVGCGMKFTQALIGRDMPIGSYTGLDVYEPAIEFLQSTVKDARFEYHHLDFFNERYNPTGVPMNRTSTFPLGDETFDTIVAYSLFTHLDPEDFETMLRIMRRHAESDTRLVFTVFLDQHSDDGHGLINQYSRAFGASIAGRTDTYQDFFSDDPLRVALYTESYARELLRRADWEILNIGDPTRFSQHIFIAQPANR